MERGEAVAGLHPVGDAPPAARRGRAARRPRPGRRRRWRARAASSGWISTNGAGVEPVEPGDLAGLRHRVPLVRQAPGVERERVVVVGQLGARAVRPGWNTARPVGGGEAHAAAPSARRCGSGSGCGPDRPGAAGHCTGLVAQALVRDAARGRSPVAGLRTAPDLVEDLLGRGVREGVGEAHLAGDAGDQLPVRRGPRRAGRRPAATSVTLRSELTITPSPSAHMAAGSTMSA